MVSQSTSGAGPLRHQVTIQTRSISQDALGQAIATWSDGTTIWARVEPLSGSETAGQVQTQATMTHKVTIRYRSGMGVLDRLKFGTRILEINAVRNPEERNIWLELDCQEVLP